MAGKFKWTSEAAEYAVNTYNAANKDNAVVDEIAAALSTDEVEVTRRQVISKLTHEKVYVKEVKEKKEAQVDEGPTKRELLESMTAAGFNVEGLANANRDALTRVNNLVSAAVSQGVNVSEV